MSVAMRGTAGVDVPGVELFMVVDPSAPIPPDGVQQYSIVAVTGGVNGQLLEREDAMRAVIKVTQDATTLAKVAMLVYRREGELLQAPKDDHQRKAGVVAPAPVSGAVEFWIHTAGVSRMLLRGRLDLAKATLEVGAPPVSKSDAIANAITALGGTSRSMHRSALKTLADSCSDPAASKALLDALAGHSSEDVRGAAADAAPACGTSAVDALIHSLEHDTSRIVRSKVITALGTIGDRKARPALEKLLTSDLGTVVKAALDKLK